MSYTRRDFGKLAMASLPATTLLAAKLDSNFGGVQMGVNAPYSFHNMPGGADDIINYCTQTGIGALELRMQPVEAWLKAPAWVNPIPLTRPNAAPAESSGAPKKGRAPMTPEQIAERKAAVEALDKWRLSQSMDGFKAFRKKYEDAGLLIQIVKFDGIGD
ncbi:MAG TPA: hypothetical protein VMJ75_12780, partial [Candidatus Acidoferrales bacterium]|nr:hypothetical protein [Candidatus Acidoferrales bacterium]